MRAGARVAEGVGSGLGPLVTLSVTEGVGSVLGPLVTLSVAVF